MASERKNHAAVLLESGAVLVTGGITSAGTATNAAEIYHSGSDSWSSAGTMSDPRSGHTATLLGNECTSDVVFAAPSWTLEEAAEAMTNGGFRHLIVLDEHEPVGIVSVRDIIRCWAPVRTHAAVMAG